MEINKANHPLIMCVCILPVLGGVRFSVLLISLPLAASKLLEVEAHFPLFPKLIIIYLEGWDVFSITVLL